MRPRVLFLSATEREMLPLRKLLRRRASAFVSKLAVTGVGKASAACCASRELERRRPDLAVQVGCAGAFPGTRLSLGDVVVSSLEILGDEGAFTPDGFIDLEELRLPVARAGKKVIFNKVPVHTLRGTTWKRLLARVDGKFAVRRGRTVTVSTISGTIQRARELAARWHPLAESMEGAAAAIAAISHGRRLIEARGISNIAGDRDHARWDIDTACEHAAEVALALVELELGP